MIKGSIVALVTPFLPNGAVDREKLRFLIEWHIRNKTDGILVCGTTGESATLSHSEHKMVVDIAVDQAKGRIPVIAGAGSNCTREAIELSLHAKKAKADAVLVITPYYNRPTQEGLYRHFQKISKEASIPIIIYNVPSRTGVNILPETVARAYTNCKNIIGIKEASGSLDQITRMMTLVDRRFVLYSGSDEINLPILSVGGRGAISVIANIVPKQTKMLIDSFMKGNLERARKMQIYLYDLVKAMFIETNPIPVKTSLSLMKITGNRMRLPLCQMSDANLKRLISVLKRYQLI